MITYIIKKCLEDSSIGDTQWIPGVKGRLTAGLVCKHAHGPTTELPHTATSELERLLTNLIGKFEIYPPR